MRARAAQTAETCSPRDQTLKENSLKKKEKNAQGENIKNQLWWFLVQQDEARRGGWPCPLFSEFQGTAISGSQERDAM